MMHEASRRFGVFFVIFIQTAPLKRKASLKGIRLKGGWAVTVVLLLFQLNMSISVFGEVNKQVLTPMGTQEESLC